MEQFIRMNNLLTLRELYLQCRQQGIPVAPKTAAIAIQSVGDYSGIRSRYAEIVKNAVQDYLLDVITGQSAKGQFKSGMATAFLDAFETGFIDTQGAGATYDPDEEDSQWLASRLEQEIANIDSLFVTMKAMKDDQEEPLTDDEISNYASDRSAGYATTLDGVYGQGKLRSRKSVMLTLEGSDGKESCPECIRYKGQRHRARWWMSHGLVPAPGNENYTCGNYQCQHVLNDDSGNQWAGVVE
jgi:hypothetical protein